MSSRRRPRSRKTRFVPYPVSKRTVEDIDNGTDVATATESLAYADATIAEFTAKILQLTHTVSIMDTGSHLYELNLDLLARAKRIESDAMELKDIAERMLTTPQN